MAPDFRRDRSGERDDSSKPVLITGARQSYRDELAARKRRYHLLMSVRLPALFLAAGAHVLWHNPWITAAIVIGSVPIPWIAVIGANDRPPLSKAQARTYNPGRLSSYTPQALPSGISGGRPGDGRPDDPHPHNDDDDDNTDAAAGRADFGGPRSDPHPGPDEPDESDPAQ